MTTIDLNLLQTEPAEQYHASAARYLTSHQLMDFMKCPWLHRKKQLGLVADRDSQAYLLGRAAHCRILEGRDIYESQFAFGGPINPTTRRPFGQATKAFAEWAAVQGKPVLTQEQVELIEQMAAGVAMNEAAVDLLLAGKAEGVVRASYGGLPCQARLDWVHPQRGLVDLKTCEDLTWFEADARRFSYPHQLAFYQALLAKAVAGECESVHIIAVEKREPFRCGVWRLSDNLLLAARRQNEAAIRRLRACQQSDCWPTGHEEVRVLDTA
ncbi:MAG TPA: PD-(D/E)XK nuclease-like domain-containing protein [Phycisphaerae bacterium]|nr:PD-(D/E)XK nuclease-like domain-containing protein [Phycisphaerae bacterium]